MDGSAASWRPGYLQADYRPSSASMRRCELGMTLGPANWSDGEDEMRGSEKALSPVLCIVVGSHIQSQLPSLSPSSSSSLPSSLPGLVWRRGKLGGRTHTAHMVAAPLPVPGARPRPEKVNVTDLSPLVGRTPGSKTRPLPTRGTRSPGKGGGAKEGAHQPPARSGDWPVTLKLKCSNLLIRKLQSQLLPSGQGCMSVAVASHL